MKDLSGLNGRFGFGRGRGFCGIFGFLFTAGVMGDWGFTESVLLSSSSKLTCSWGKFSLSWTVLSLETVLVSSLVNCSVSEQISVTSNNVCNLLLFASSVASNRLESGPSDCTNRFDPGSSTSPTGNSESFCAEMSVAIGRMATVALTTTSGGTKKHKIKVYSHHASTHNKLL